MAKKNTAPSMSDKIKTLRDKELCEFIMKLCDTVKADAGTEFRGGVYPDNISEGSDGTLHIGAANDYNWQGEELRFISPELYWNGKRTPASDVYSIGMVMYYALNDGKLPFDGECDDPLLRRMGGTAIEAPAAAGRRMGEIITKAISFKAADRYQSMDELRAVIASCNTSLFLNGEPTAEAVLKKSDDELSDVERMMVNIIEKSDEPPVESKADDIPVEERVTRKPTPRPGEMPAPPANRARVGISSERINIDPAVQYTSENIERERKLAKEVKRRRRRPIIVILILCALLIIAAIVFNYLSNNAPVPVDAELDFSAPITGAIPTPEPVEAEVVIVGFDETAQNNEENGEENGENISEEPVEHSYEFITEDVSWTMAQRRAEEKGGHLVVINDAAELNEIIALAEKNGISRVWIGCHRDESGNLVWENGESVSFYQWGKGEPSAYDYNDNVAEDYVMLWNLNGWCYNDNRNDPIADYPFMYSGTVGFVVEYGR